jgi:CarD family transcriptional regulator
MYEPGQYVICKSGGVWRVDSIDDKEIRLTEHETENVKSVPIGGDEIVREIASKDAILEAIDRVGFIPVIKAPNDKVRVEILGDAMAEYDEIEWLKVIKSVYLRREERRLSSAETEFADRAKRYLHGEISVLLNIPMDTVEAHIAAAVSNNDW